jgi:lipopolysaccharide export system protein LptC
MNSARLWRHGKEQFFAWLPALMMALFALGTAWLVRHTPDFAAASGPPRPLAHEPDYQMRSFAVRSFDAAGRMTSELRGVEGHHYPDTDTLEVSQPRVRSFDPKNQLTVGRADRGVSNGDGSRSSSTARRRWREASVGPGGRATPRLEFRGEYLHAWSRPSASAPTSRSSCCAAPTASPASASTTTTKAAWPTWSARCAVIQPARR